MLTIDLFSNTRKSKVSLTESARKHFDVDGWTYYTEEEREDDNIKLWHYAVGPNGEKVEIDYTPYDYMPKSIFSLWLRVGKPTSRSKGSIGPMDADDIKRMADQSKDNMSEMSDISGLLHAARHYNRSFIITAELAEGGVKKFRVKAQSERVAKEKFLNHHSQATIVDVKEEGVVEDALSESEKMRPQGKILKKLRDYAIMKPTLTFQNLRQAGKESVITDAIMAAKQLRGYYQSEQNLDTAQFVYNLENELDAFKRGYNSYTNNMDLSDLLRGTLGKMKFQTKAAAPAAQPTAKPINSKQALVDFNAIARNNGSLTYQRLKDAGHADKVLNAIQACGAFYDYFKNNKDLNSAKAIDNLRSDLIAFKNADILTLSQLIKRGTLDKISLQEQGVAEDPIAGSLLGLALGAKGAWNAGKKSVERDFDTDVPIHKAMGRYVKDFAQGIVDPRTYVPKKKKQEGVAEGEQSSAVDVDAVLAILRQTQSRLSSEGGWSDEAKSQFEDVYRRTRQALMQGDWPAAADYLQSVGATNPDLFDAFVGAMWEAAGLPETASWEEFEQAMSGPVAEGDNLATFVGPNESTQRTDEIFADRRQENFGNGVTADQLDIGDDVIITGPVRFEGATGVIDSFGRDKRFVVVNLYNHGKHSFHSSDVEGNDYAGSEEEEELLSRKHNIHDRDYDDDDLRESHVNKSTDLNEISDVKLANYISRAGKEIADLTPHAEKSEYRNIAKNLLSKRQRGKALASLKAQNRSGVVPVSHSPLPENCKTLESVKYYYAVVGTLDQNLREDFGMQKDSKGWHLTESATPKQKLDALRAFGSPLK